jgi:hypothetical protein
MSDLKYKVLTVAEARNLARYELTVMQPPREALAQLREGHAVYLFIADARVGTKPKAERLVVVIDYRRGTKFMGRICQLNVQGTRYHGLKPRDMVEFEMKHIADIFFENPNAKKTKEIKLI